VCQPRNPLAERTNVPAELRRATQSGVHALRHALAKARLPAGIVLSASSPVPARAVMTTTESFTLELHLGGH
jgi:hypothetical protein